MAAANASGSRLATSKPFFASSMISGTPPRASATHGTPCAMAASKALPRGSACDGNAKTSIAAKIVSISVSGGRIFTASGNCSSFARFRTADSSGPSPRKSKHKREIPPALVSAIRFLIACVTRRTRGAGTHALFPARMRRHFRCRKRPAKSRTGRAQFRDWLERLPCGISTPS